MPVDLPKVINVDIVFVRPVVFFEYGCDLLFVFVQVRLSPHGFHKLIETDATCFFEIEFGDDFINCLFVRTETILSKEEG